MSEGEDRYAAARLRALSAGDPPKYSRPKLADMAEVLDNVIAQKSASQRALVAASMIEDYDPRAMHEIVCLEEAMAMMLRVRANIADWSKPIQNVITGEATRK